MARCEGREVVDFVRKASQVRETAEEIRVRIGQRKYDESKAVLLRLADDYHRLADTYGQLEKLGASTGDSGQERKVY